MIHIQHEQIFETKNEMCAKRANKKEKSSIIKNTKWCNTHTQSHAMQDDNRKFINITYLNTMRPPIVHLWAQFLDQDSDMECEYKLSLG